MFNAVGQVRDSTYMKLGMDLPPSSITGARVTVVNIETPEGGAVETACQSQSPSPSPRAQEIEGVQRSRDVTVAADDLRAMLCLDSANCGLSGELGELPVKSERLVVLRAKIKNARRKVDLMWSVLR